MAVGDIAGVLDNLHPITCFRDGVLELRQPLSPGTGIARRHKPLSPEPAQPDSPSDICLEGRGLLLVPEAFTWPRVSVILEQHLQPSLYYSPRGVANLWGKSTLTPSDALAFALGRQRPRVLMAVSDPSTTQEVARVLKVTSGNVSHHLGRLRKAGLIEVQRDERLMFYSLSAKGKALLELFA